jgi:CRP/FNR family transcriptional regulator, cyclic AMP receptor protein
MSTTDVVGYLASLLVLATFCMRRMVALRLLAIGSNVAFIAYAMLAGIHPVLLLHAVLLPMNVWRLVEILQGRDAAAKAGVLP